MNSSRALRTHSPEDRPAHTLASGPGAANVRHHVSCRSTFGSSVFGAIISGSIISGAVQLSPASLPRSIGISAISSAVSFSSSATCLAATPIRIAASAFRASFSDFSAPFNCLRRLSRHLLCDGITRVGINRRWTDTWTVCVMCVQCVGVRRGFVCSSSSSYVSRV